MAGRAVDLGAGLLHHQRLLGRSNLGFASAAAVIMLVITAPIFLPLVLLTAWQSAARARRRRDDRRSPTSEAAAQRAAERRASSAQEEGHPRPSIAIIVFLTICAAFFCVPLYVIIVTSFKTMDQIRDGAIFSLPHRLPSRPGTRLGQACSGIRCDGLKVGFWNSVAILFPSPGPLDRALVVTGYALALWNVRWADTLPLHPLHLRLRAVPDHHDPADHHDRRAQGLWHASGASRSSTRCSRCRS